MQNGTFRFTDSDANNHYEEGIQRIEKWDSDKVWTVALYDADNSNYLYIKRFTTEYARKPQGYLGENAANREVLLIDTPYPRLQVTFGGADAVRPPMEIDVESFIGVKGFKAKCKRVTTWQVAEVVELPPTREPMAEEPDEEPANEQPENLDPDAGKSQQQVIDEITGQLNLFPDDDNEI